MVRLLTLLLTLFLAAPPPADYDALRKQAEASYAEKSFSRAHELYAQALALDLTAEERRWVEFRLADTAWREEPNAQHETERAALQELIRQSGDKHDLVRADANESIGDLIETSYDHRPAAPFYSAALEWWAGSSDPNARDRYLRIVFAMATPPSWSQVPDVASIRSDILGDALRIAQSEDDRAHLRYLLALRLVAPYVEVMRERSLELLDENIALGKATRWYAASLMTAARVLAMGPHPDYVRALEYARRITTEFPRSEREYDEAVREIDEITRELVAVTCTTTFLPGAVQEVRLTWRNVQSIDLTLRRVDLTKIELKNERDRIRDDGAPVVRRWREELVDEVRYAPGNKTLTIAPRFANGAYVLTAEAGRNRDDALIIVSDANIVTHAIGGRSDIYVSDALRGAPIAGADVRVWWWEQQGNNSVAVSQRLRSGADGIAHADLRAPNGEVVIMAAAGARQALFRSWGYGSYGLPDDEWRFYAMTDRPAYRPGDIVHWKLVARERGRGDDEWSTPAKRSVEYTINGPRGKVADGVATFNEFGSFWADLPVTSTMPLGSYSIELKNDKAPLGYATLFALEEYKLPELALSIDSPQTYRLGDTVEAAIDARYYFGAPATSATIDVRVTRSSWFPFDEWEWNAQARQYSDGREVLHRTVHTDANGRAVIGFDTSVDTENSSYFVSACATDSSRRQVCSTQNIVVMLQRYRVAANAKHRLAAPGDPVGVDFKATNAKGKPVETNGTVTVTRKTWDGDERRYREETISTTKLATDAEGIARLTFRPDRTGYYFVTWSSVDARSGTAKYARDVVKAETAVWVTRNTSASVGYHSAGLELIVDREGLHAGGRAPVLIATPAAGRWVLLTTSGSRIIETQLVHLDGNVKLVDIPLDRRFVPDFQLTASSVFDDAMTTTVRQVSVADDRTVSIEVKPDRDAYKPRESGTVTLTTRDAAGKPVAAEVSLSVLDESVTAISAEDATDMHDYFYPKRGALLQVAGELQVARFRRADDERRGKEAPQEEDEEALDAAGGYLAFGKKTVAESITVTAEAPLLSRQPPPAPAPPPAPTAAEITVRHDFRATAFWKPDVVTGANGVATISFDYPETLTAWRATARAVTTDSRFGRSSATTHTSLPLLVRLEAPRFFVAGDRSTVSAVINNNGDQAVTVTPSLEPTGVAIVANAQTTIAVPAHGEARADWTVAADHPGTATLRVAARTPDGGDAMEKSITVYEHGIEKLIARSGKLRGDEALVHLDLPAARRDTTLTVQISPSLAVTMIDAVPYLVDYPYGCTEQTMSRFLPAAIVARTLARSGLDRGEVERHLTGGRAKLDDVVSQSLQRLYDFQRGDGGWGWWKDGDSDAHMTAYVVWGFAVAREGDITVADGAIERAATWLDNALAKSDDAPDDQAWQLHALAAWRHATTGAPTQSELRAFANAYDRREHLSAYSRALLALAAHGFGDAERANVLIRNLENGVVIDRAPDRSILVNGSSSTAETMATAHWGADRFWWRWYDSPVESTAFSLQALMAIDPHNALVEPVMNWLVKNRRGARWNNTRDTAIALLALNDYLVTSGESNDGASYELSVNGRVIATKTVGASDVLRDPSRFTIEPGLIGDANEIRIRRTGGRAPIYFAAEARMTSLEEPITAAGNEIFVKRDYLKLVPRRTLLNGDVYDRVPLRDGETLASGDRVEVVATIETKNDYEYLMFEDLKPAGLEATELRSGGSLFATDKTGHSQWIYQELRDRNVALFASRLPQGIWQIRYTLRAETPGSFHALPLMGQAMYVPEIRANGEETHVVVR